MENQLQIFSNDDGDTVRCFIDYKGTAWINVEDAGRGLGFVQIKNGVEYVRYETINNYLNEFGYNSFSQLVGKDDYIPENMFYRLAMKAKNEAAEKFQAWIADEVIPAIRKYGYYVAPNATFDINLIKNLIPEINLTEDQLNLLKTATPMLAAQVNAIITRLLYNYGKNNDVTALVALDLPGEIWKWFKNYEGLYQGSTYGRARSFFKGECNILIPTLGPRGYYTVCLYKDNKGENGQKEKKTFRLNRLIAETFIPNPLNLPEVHHKDHNKANNRVDNLEWVTGEQNREYAKEGNRYLKGEDNPNAKLTENDVRFIREHYKAGDPEFGNISLAERFKVSDVTITNIVTFKSWKNVQ